MTPFDELLALQGLDLTIDQVRHRLAHLPERAARDEHLRSVAAFDTATAGVQARRDELAREQKRIEDEVALVEDKAKAVDAKLYSGTVTSPKELQAFQEDLDALRRRQRQLEDGVLEVMELVEPVDAELEARAAERDALDRRGAELEAALAAVEEQLSAELAATEARRAEAVADLPDEDLARYERLRRDLGGIAVARLAGSSCGGCHLQLSAVELDRIRHQAPDAWVFCEECGRLLVR
jgi:uncharacterized protein